MRGRADNTKAMDMMYATLRAQGTPVTRGTKRDDDEEFDKANPGEELPKATYFGMKEQEGHARAPMGAFTR